MGRRLAALAGLTAAVLWTTWPAAGFAFLNWDDHAVVVSNAALGEPGVARWAFTTTHMQHYQPLSWLVWAAARSGAGVEPGVFHALNIGAHLLSVLLLAWAVREITALARPAWRPAAHDAAGLAAAAVWGLHPLRVEVVAWVSALPYALALVFLLTSLLAWLRARQSGSGGWGWAAVLFYAASLGARPMALGYPVALVLLDWWLCGRTVRSAVRSVWPHAVLALAAAFVESVARTPGLNDAPWLFRLQSTASAPFVYLWRTLVPVGLTPLDLQPLDPQPTPWILAAALAGVVTASVAAWRWRRAWPGAAAAWTLYLALLLPAAGLVPSGLQATADRYAYLPGMVLAAAAVVAAIDVTRQRTGLVRPAAVAMSILSVALAVESRRALGPWADSISLWTRVVSLQPVHDVGLYNLGTALADAGRRDEAAARYREVLAIQPGHLQARTNLNLLEAARLESEGNDLAAGGNMEAAAARYRDAVTLDPARTHSHAALGIALASLGRSGEAVPALRRALEQGATDPAIPNTLGVLLIEAGQPADARRIFETALAVHQTDVGLAHNLARVLVTSAGMTPDDAALGLRLARAVVEATGGRDPRVLDTLATALAANRRREEARATSARAAKLAEEQGNRELAVQITARARAWRDPGP